MSTPPKSHALARVALRFLDLAGGLVASFTAYMASIMIWGFLTGDADGGEPFANTVFGSLLLFPLFSVLFIVGPFAWWHRRTLKERARIFGYQLLANIAALGLSWLVGR